jgi:hypothetical protein
MCRCCWAVAYIYAHLMLECVCVHPSHLACITLLNDAVIDHSSKLVMKGPFGQHALQALFMHARKGYCWDLNFEATRHG